MLCCPPPCHLRCDNRLEDEFTLSQLFSAVWCTNHKLTNMSSSYRCTGACCLRSVLDFLHHFLSSSVAFTSLFISVGAIDCLLIYYMLSVRLYRMDLGIQEFKSSQNWGELVIWTQKNMSYETSGVSSNKEGVVLSLLRHCLPVFDGNNLILHFFFPVTLI